MIAIDIGDWSKDGHNQSETFWFESNSTIAVIREAFFKAQKKIPDADPTTYLNEYEETEISAEDFKRILELLPGLRDYAERHDVIEEDADAFDDIYPEPEFMAIWTAEFIMAGNGSVNLRILARPTSLHFAGRDTRGRHIGQIGYGIFGS